MMSTVSPRNRSPFTPSQWQELEQQALVFKYMVTGTPVPPDLIYSIKRSLDNSVSSRLFPHHPIGWGCFEMGFGRKVDPEPGRCRRTDGKKWRCSKEAYPDSKYCERHMHRGRNRSRKPVEVSSTATNTNNNSNTSLITTTPSYNNNRNLSLTTNNNITSPSSSFPFSTIPSSIESQNFNQSYHQNASLNPFFYSQTNPSRTPDSDFSPQDSTTHQLFMDSGSYSQDDKDFRHVHGIREGLDERVFFPEASGSAASARSYPDSYHQQLSMNPYKSYSNSQFQNINDNNPRQQEEQHLFVLGTDFKSTRQSKGIKESETTTQKPLHHFFEEWSPKNTDSWLDLAPNSRIPTDE